MDHDAPEISSSGLAPAFLKSGWFWAALRSGALVAMAGVMAAAWGRRGIADVDVPDPLMYTNLGNLAFWVLWLMGIVLLIPLVGRAWCGICPLGALNERVSRYGLKKAFPGLMRNQHLKALILVGTVLLMGIVRIHHYPDATALYLLAWTAGALILGVFFTGRSLCAYLCPVGGMMGLYGRTAPVRCGVREQEVCRTCEERQCVRGAFTRFSAELGRLNVSLRLKKNPCPVNLRVWDMDGTDRCLLCCNCMRACPLDNVALFGRKPMASLWNERYPRFSDTVLLASLMGFALLSFSRFWPAAQGVLTAPVGWIGAVARGAARPVSLLWLGAGLPLTAFLLAAAFVAWSRSNSSVVNPPAEPDARDGFPLRVWIGEKSAKSLAAPVEEERVMGTDTIRGLSAVYAPAVIPFLLASHMVLALVKLNTKLPYLPLAAADPPGIRTYMAIWELGLMGRPEPLLPMGAVKIVSLGLLILGTVLSLTAHGRISRREGRGALPMLAPLVLLATVVYGGLFHWLF